VLRYLAGWHRVVIEALPGMLAGLLTHAIVICVAVALRGRQPLTVMPRMRAAQKRRIDRTGMDLDSCGAKKDRIG
jgi:hypothetical protein